MVEKLQDLLNIFYNLDENIINDFNILNENIQEGDYFPLSKLRDVYGGLINEKNLIIQSKC